MSVVTDKKEDKEDKKEDKEDKEDKKEESDSEDSEEESDSDSEDSEEESDEESDEDAYEDPSIARMKGLEKMNKDPPKIPGFDLFTLEPKLTVAATKIVDMIINKLSDPQLAENFMDNITKSVDLSLANKVNKIEYLQQDDIKNHKDTSKIINDIHNETVKPTPFKVSVIKGGSTLFFTEKECSFF
jgi:hypothetical protein